MFRDRADAGHQLAERFRGRELRQPIVLCIPRGGVVVGAGLANDLGADLDVVLSRKLRAPNNPEVAIGAIGEDGCVEFNSYGEDLLKHDCAYVEAEKQFQLKEIGRRRRVFRRVRPHASVAGRSVLVVDDGIATGSTMHAALHVLERQKPHEVILAVPVASPDRLESLKALCDDAVCLLAPEEFWAIGQFYRDFTQVEDSEVLDLLKPYGAACVS